MDTSIVIIIIKAVLGGGFFAFLASSLQRKDEKSAMLMGLAHHEIMDAGYRYLERGYITKEELEDFNHYLYDPYVALGGNGSGRAISLRVNNLPIHNQ